jgi:hypothetical protein
MRTDRESDDFPGEDLPYTMEKLKRRGIVARLYYGAGLRKLEDDYLNPKRGDVLASQRRYRRYLAGDKRVVKEASLAVWSPVILAAVTPVLIGVTMVGAFAWQQVSPYLKAASQSVSSRDSARDTAAASSPPTSAASPNSVAGNTAQSAVVAAPADSSASDAVASQQSPGQTPVAAPTADADDPTNGNGQDTQVGQDSSSKLEAQLAQAEQQFDAGQYENAAATTAAILAVEPGNVSAQRLHAASLRNLATVTAADSAEARGFPPVPSGPKAQAAFFPAQVSHHQTICRIWKLPIRPAWGRPIIQSASANA